MRVHLDFETRSQLSVTDAGGWAYSIHPTTDILCISYAVDDEPVVLVDYESVQNWSMFSKSVFVGSPIEGKDPDASPLEKLAADPDVIFYAHNAFFEQCIWRNMMVKRYGFSTIPVNRWRCTAAKAAAMSLPRDLDGVTQALELPVKKDNEGHKIMMKLSRPRRGKFGGELVFWEPNDCPDDFQRLYEYNMQDVNAERWVDHTLPDLNAFEQQVWVLDQEINFRGVQLDVPAIHRIMDFIEKTVTELTHEFQAITDYCLEGPSQIVRFREWLAENDCDMPNLQAPTVDKRIAAKIDGPKVIRALQLRRALSKISTSKYTAMLNRVDSGDGRLRDILLYCAAITKRWGGRGVQLHNMPRGTVNSDVCIDTILNNPYDWFKALYGDMMAAYSSCTRGTITASPGCELFVGDFSAIEACGVSWLAGQQSALDVFHSGRDVYCEEATGIYSRPVTKEDKYERGVGKVAILALGYNGGIRALASMARNLSISLAPAYDSLWGRATEDEKKKARTAYDGYLTRAEKADEPDPLDRASGYAADIIKQRWRAKNPQIVKYWNDIEYAAIQAVLTGKKHTVETEENEDGVLVRPQITFGMRGQDLLCKLPSGNCIVYPFARISNKETSWGQKKLTLSYRTKDEENFQFMRTFTYGGKLVENITQAVARDLLAAALLRIDAARYPIVLHVHDEIVADVPHGFGDLDNFESIMAIIPEWAAGFPIKVEAWKGHRYKK